MEIEARVANRLVMDLGSDDMWTLEDQRTDAVIFYHKGEGTYWKLSCDGVWADWLASQMSVCPSCDQFMLMHLRLKRVIKVPYQSYRWENAQS